ncbi:MAG: Crp/Fnr family transcriptional regulator [Syntrophobacteraceae bacterium]|nr:Crp/Fnr family transcriptional regulator [Syntrophobacteraceae bacterium]
MFEQFRCFSNLTAEHFDQLRAISEPVSVQKGTIVFAPGDESRGFYAVSSGAVRLYRVSPGGREITLAIADGGNTLAEASIFSGKYHCYAQTLKDSTLWRINKDGFLEILRKDARFACAWIRFLSLEVIDLRQRMEELSIKTPKARIISYILLLSEIQNHDSVTLPAHRKSIATLLGMTHETFYRTARELEIEGMVRFDGQRIEIMSRTLLEQCAD